MAAHAKQMRRSPLNLPFAYMSRSTHDLISLINILVHEINGAHVNIGVKADLDAR